jgi:hypothetical protein
MSQTPGEQPGSSATARAEDLLDQAGQRIGTFVGLTHVRIQQALTAVREEAERRDTEKLTQGGQPEQKNGPYQPANQRAEVMVDRMGQRLGSFAANAGLQMQKALALLREEAEDIWAEAQSIRDQGKQK